MGSPTLESLCYLWVNAILIIDTFLQVFVKLIFQIEKLEKKYKNVPPLLSAYVGGYCNLSKFAHFYVSCLEGVRLSDGRSTKLLSSQKTSVWKKKFTKYLTEKSLKKSHKKFCNSVTKKSKKFSQKSKKKSHKKVWNNVTKKSEIMSQKSLKSMSQKSLK